MNKPEEGQSKRRLRLTTTANNITVPENKLDRLIESLTSNFGGKATTGSDCSLVLTDPSKEIANSLSTKEWAQLHDRIVAGNAGNATEFQLFDACA